MRDYALTTKILRSCAENSCEGCPIGGAEYTSKDCRKVHNDAADAIEELLAENTEAFSADIISMQNAVETDVWLMVWAAEPNRKIHVQMTYDELWKIVQRERENAIEPPKEDAE